MFGFLNGLLDFINSFNVLIGTFRADAINGSSDNDFIAGLPGNDIIAGNNGNDFIFGGIGDDLIIGNAGNDTLLGSIGDDRLHGSIDDDKLLGGKGADTLNGEFGSDILTGGHGKDVFAFDSRTGGLDSPAGENTGVDLITDFSRKDRVGLYEFLDGSALVEDLGDDVSVSAVNADGDRVVLTVIENVSVEMVEARIEYFDDILS